MSYVYDAPDYGQDSTPDNKGNLNLAYIDGNSIYYQKNNSTPPKLVTTTQDELSSVNILDDLGDLYIFYTTDNIEYDNLIGSLWYTSLHFPLKADFSYSAHSIDELGSLIQFVNFNALNSTGKIETYFWEFGDGGRLGSDKTTMSHIYFGNKKIYPVTLTVYDKLGNFDSITKEIEMEIDLDKKENHNLIPATETVLSVYGMAILLKETYKNVVFTAKKLHLNPSTLVPQTTSNALNPILSNINTSTLVKAAVMITIGAIICILASSAPIIVTMTVLLLVIKSSGII